MGQETTKNKTSSLLKHFIIYGSGTIIINAAGFLLIPIYTNYLPVSEFGTLEIINRCVEVFNIIFAAGLGITSLSFYASENEQEQKNAVISTAMVTLSVLAALGAILFLILSKTISTHFFSNLEYLPMFRMASVIIIADMLTMIPTAYIRARIKSKLFIIVSSVRFITILCLNIIFVVSLHMHIKGVILGNMIGGLFFAVILVTYTFANTGFYFDSALFKKMLSFGLPFIPGGLFLFILNNGDRFFIQTYLNSSVLGVYSLGYKIGTLVMMFVLGPFLNVWGPYMFKLNKDSGTKSFDSFFLYLIVVYCVVSLPLAVFSKELIKIISNKNYAECYKVVPFILASYLFWSTASFFDSGFYITRKTFYKPFIMGAATCLSIFLYWILIPAYGLLGGAYATAISFGVYSLLCYIISNRIFPIRYPLFKFVYVAGLWTIIYIVSRVMPQKGLAMTILMKAPLVVLYPVLIILTGVFNKDELKQAKQFLLNVKLKLCGKTAVTTT